MSKAKSAILLGLSISLAIEKVNISIPECKREKWLHQIHAAVQKDELTPEEASSLMGRLTWGGTTVFAQAGKAFLRPLAARAAARYKVSKLNDPLRCALKWWHHHLGKAQSITRSIPIWGNPKRIELFTDASLYAIGGYA